MYVSTTLTTGKLIEEFRLRYNAPCDLDAAVSASSDDSEYYIEYLTIKHEIYNDNVIETDWGWFDYHDEEEDFTMYIIIKNMTVTDVKDLKLIKLIKIEYDSQNKSVFTTSDAIETINETNILDDEKDIYKFILLQMENYCTNVIDCFDFLTIFEIIYCHVLRRNMINQELYCNYPIGAVISTGIKKFRRRNN